MATPTPTPAAAAAAAPAAAPAAATACASPLAAQAPERFAALHLPFRPVHRVKSSLLKNKNNDLVLVTVLATTEVTGPGWRQVEKDLVPAADEAVAAGLVSSLGMAYSPLSLLTATAKLKVCLDKAILDLPEDHPVSLDAGATSVTMTPGELRRFLEGLQYKIKVVDFTVPIAPGKKTSINTQSIKGTRDWPPEVMRERVWLFNQFHAVASLFAFEQYDAPILEEEDLYKRKAGEEISEQIYNFVTKDDTRVSLRPEMTPSLARLVLQKGTSMLLPAKWYTICQCWRFEAIQKGRKREHYQWNMDVIGTKSVNAEAELIVAAVEFCRRVGLTHEDVLIKVNSRKILQKLLMAHGVTEEMFSRVCIVVDKMDKVSEDEILDDLGKEGVARDTAATIYRLLKSGTLEEIRQSIHAQTAAAATAEGKEGDQAEDPAIQEVEQFFQLLRGYGVSEWVTFTPNVVRGLVYYTGIVFEGFDRKQRSRAFFGGGRYDELLSKLGSNQQIPCCGFGFGDCVIMDMLRERNLVPDLKPAVQDLVIPYSEDMRENAANVAQLLRARGRSVDIMFSSRNVKKAFEHADRIGAERAVFVAPAEWAEGKVAVKELRKGKGRDTDRDEVQKAIPLAEL